MELKEGRKEMFYLRTHSTHFILRVLCCCFTYIDQFIMLVLR